MTINLLFPGIVVFALMVIGLVLTVLEFNRLDREDARNNSDRDSS